MPRGASQSTAFLVVVVVVQGDGRLCVSLHQQYLIKELELPTGETDVAYFPPQFLQVQSSAGAVVFFLRTRMNCILSIKQVNERNHLKQSIDSTKEQSQQAHFG